jgi:hypothetical protein
MYLLPLVFWYPFVLSTSAQPPANIQTHEGKVGAGEVQGGDLSVNDSESTIRFCGTENQQGVNPGKGHEYEESHRKYFDNSPTLAAE